MWSGWFWFYAVIIKKENRVCFVMIQSDILVPVDQRIPVIETELSVQFLSQSC